MRDIRFRGKRLDNGEWVYGCLYMEEREQEYQQVRDGAVNNQLGVWTVPVIQVVDENGTIINTHPVS